MKRFRRHPDELTLALLAGGDLAPLGRLRVGSHVKRCETCRRTVASYARARSAVAAGSVVPEVDFAALSHRVRVAAEQQRERTGISFGWRRKAALAALGAAALAIALILPFPGDESPDQGIPAEPLVHDLAPALAQFQGTEAQITSDGSVSVRTYHQASGALTITDYYAP